MEIFIVWFIFAILVGVAASSRGRSGFGWFLLSSLLSPLIGAILLVLFPNLRQEKMMTELLGGRNETQSPQIPHQDIFEPEGVFEGIPYRVSQDGSIEAIMQGRLVRFSTYDKFITANGGQI